MNPKNPPEGAKLLVLTKNWEGMWLPLCFAKDFEDGEQRRANVMRGMAMWGGRFYGVRYIDVDVERDYDPFVPRDTDPKPLWERECEPS